MTGNPLSSTRTKPSRKEPSDMWGVTGSTEKKPLSLGKEEGLGR